MASMNKVLLIGRIGNDLDLKYSKSGQGILGINLATDESYTSQDGNRVQKTEWHRVIVYGKQAENCANYLQKGSMVFIEGSLATRKWQDQQKQDRYVTEIKAYKVLFLDSKTQNAKNETLQNTCSHSEQTENLDELVPF